MYNIHQMIENNTTNAIIRVNAYIGTRYVRNSTQLYQNIRGFFFKILYLDQLSTNFDHRCTEMHLLNFAVKLAL